MNTSDKCIKIPDILLYNEEKSCKKETPETRKIPENIVCVPEALNYIGRFMRNIILALTEFLVLV